MSEGTDGVEAPVKKKSSIKHKVLASVIALAIAAAGAAGGHVYTAKAYLAKYNPETAKDNTSRIAAILFVRGCIAAAQQLSGNPMSFMEAANACQNAGPQVYAALKKQITDKILFEAPKKQESKKEEDNQEE